MQKRIRLVSVLVLTTVLFTCLISLNSCSKASKVLPTSSNLLQLLEPNTFIFFKSMNAGKAYEAYKNSVWDSSDNFFDTLKSLTKKDPEARKNFERLSGVKNSFNNFLKKSNVEEILFSISKEDQNTPINFENVNACFYAKSKDAKSAQTGVKDLNSKLLEISDNAKSETIKLDGNCNGNKILINPKNNFSLHLVSKDNVIISCQKKENLIEICTEKNKGKFIKTLQKDEQFNKLNKKVSFKKDFSLLSLSYANVDRLIKEISKATSDKNKIDLTKIIALNHLIATVGITNDGTQLKNHLALDIPKQSEAGKRWSKILNKSSGHSTSFSIGEKPILSLISDARAVGEIINAVLEDAPMKEKEKRALNQIYSVVSQVETLALSIHQENQGVLPIPGIILRASGEKLKEAYSVFLKQIKSEMQKNGLQGMGQWSETKVKDVIVNKFLTPFGIGISLAFYDGAIYLTSSDKLLETAINNEKKITLGLNKNEIQSFSIDFTKLLGLIKKLEKQASMFTGGQPLIKDKDMLSNLGKLGKTEESMSFDDNVISISVRSTANSNKN